MRKSDNISQLNDAADLLSMVERVLDSLSVNQPQVEGDPWRGIRLTLGHVRLAILRARDAFSVEDESSYSDNSSARSRSASPLAGRIQRSPSAGQVREIVDHSSPAAEAASSDSSSRTDAS